ncbi:MAG: GGDEF domain-containing protein [Gammaproteobacteria bacterium]|nr:MAG: GGDEF domain-containing protein [Gammaproteobacteria bacterium]
MTLQVPDRLISVFEEEELKGFSRSMAELQWLLVILAILYFFIPIRPIINIDAMIVTMVCYTVLVMVFRYLNFHTRETRWKLAIETWVMITFITTILWHTGMVESPLLNLYLLVIIACAITQGKVMTLLEVALIACCYLYMGYQTYSVEVLSPETFTMLMAKFSPFLLVAYVTSMLASDIKLAKNKITVMSQTDELTGLLNLRAFNTILEKEVAVAQRYSTPYTVLMIDVDGLKQVNDHFGHTTGSRLVKIVASSLKNCVRDSDVLARYGGDEFVVLMPQTRREQAQIAAERIRAAIDHTSFDMNGIRVATTVSVGIASFPDPVSEPEAVLDKADVALYKSKQSGRNKVTYYNKSLEVVTAFA